MSPEEAAYLAGAIDGEGCITRTGGRRGVGSLRLQIANTNREWLQRFQASIGGSIQEHHGRFNKRPSFSLVLTFRESARALASARPFLFLKRQQADLFFQWLELRTTYEPKIRQGVPADPEYAAAMRALWAALQKLNQRGVVSQPYPGVAKTDRTCTLDGCDRKHYSNGYCKQHHKKYVERGGPAWHERNCQHCGKPFVAKRSDAVFCSQSCGDAARYRHTRGSAKSQTP